MQGLAVTEHVSMLFLKFNWWNLGIVISILYNNTCLLAADFVHFIEVHVAIITTLVYHLEGSVML